MSEFVLDEEAYKRIAKELPDLDGLGMTVMKLVPDLISIPYSPQSNVPVAAVCFHDTLNALLQARIGLNECFQNKIWYRERCQPPSEELAIVFMRFYIDAIVSMLYAAGEHLANGIICMLALSEFQLEKYRENRVSQQSILGHYLAAEQAGNSITKAVLTLATSKEWVKVMDYRNNWVHEQPPTVSGLGPIYRRQRQWVQSEDGKSFELGLGSVDNAQYSIDELLLCVQRGVFQFVDLFSIVVQAYLEELALHRIIVTPEGLQIKIV